MKERILLERIYDGINLQFTLSKRLLNMHRCASVRSMLIRAHQISAYVHWTPNQPEQNRNNSEHCKMWDLEGKRSNGIETKNMNELWTLESFNISFQIGMVRACYITHVIHTYSSDTHYSCCCCYCFCFCFCLSLIPRLFVCVRVKAYSRRAAALFSVICICCCCDCW